jgi:hypothetical protein
MGQTDDELRSALRSGAGFSNEELAALDSGETVVKLLAPSDKREVAVCGAVRFPQPPDLVAKVFHQSVTQNNKSVLASGRFSNPPSLTDVQYLTLDDREIEDIKECVTGDCALKLSATMIGRFREEIIWSRSDYRTQVSNLFRSMLVDYVRDYLVRGNAALIKYDDQAQQVNVEQEQASLVEGSFIFSSLVPELKDHLRSFPASDYGAAQHTISWAQIKFGLKPVVIITHAAKYVAADRVVTISRQIYASHYFDSSLAFAGAFATSSSAKEQSSYLLYVNYTRADALDGAFAKLKRNISQSEAVEKLEGLLNKTRIGLDIAAKNESRPAPIPVTNRIARSLFGGRRVLWWLVGFIVLLVFFWLTRRISSRTQRSSDRRSQPRLT